ncbi:MFS transporter [Aliivibrio fischeri]|uniref:MFS transporter n=1 Tax=Aliivibrio fischeri TaxID=668 RepID=UPI0012DA2E39|nr:MFS transporter [Aliivibrio fischeri]MUJ23976.1 MFS transporter [Aliivibrio fischeri]
MNTKPSLWLMVLLLMFPQIVETIYSPALGSIADSFAVTYSQASQTISIYFSAFALGVVVWGILADKLGRRPTMLRDAFNTKELSKVFSLMGMGISISPVLGMLLGGQLTQFGGYHYVFIALFIMALVLVAYNLVALPETQKTKQPLELKQLGLKMLRDINIWRSGCLVALFNIALFSYYQLGAFKFEQLGLSSQEFGYSGIVLGLGTFIGSYLNKYLISKQVSLLRLLQLSALLLTLGGILVTYLIDSIWFLLPMILVVMSFGIAIPNILSVALIDYKQQAGSAGALFGLMYYLIIGAGLSLAGSIQHLGIVLLICGVISFLLVAFKK